MNKMKMLFAVVLCVTAGPCWSADRDAQALRLVMERRRVSQDLLKSQFGSSARATNLLSLLEVKDFIFKPDGANRWEIQFDKIEDYLKSRPAGGAPGRS